MVNGMRQRQKPNAKLVRKARERKRVISLIKKYTPKVEVPKGLVEDTIKKINERFPD